MHYQFRWDSPQGTVVHEELHVLRHFSAAELETLLREVVAEAERRGVGRPAHTIAAPPTEPAPKFRARQSKGSGAPAGLPTGKINLIKASHSAGMKPPAIARMFRVSRIECSRP